LPPFYQGLYPAKLLIVFLIQLWLTRKKSFVSDFGHFWKKIHTMLSVKNSKLCEALRPSFWNLAKHFMNPKMGIMSE